MQEARVLGVSAARGYLEAYDAQLRCDAETRGATAVTRLGPLYLATFGGHRGFISYRNLPSADAGSVRQLVADALALLAADPAVTRIEWKTRGHDRVSGLHEALLDHGFVPGEPESIMIGEARLLAADVPLPHGVSLRRIETEADIRAMVAMQATAFGDPESESMASDMLGRLQSDDDVEFWVAEHAGGIISAGRLEPVPGTQFAGIWGGATLPDWRGQGIYRALTSARARSALSRGMTLVHSDSTEYSRPILERAGLVKVSTTTPYDWQR